MSVILEWAHCSYSQMSGLAYLIRCYGVQSVKLFHGQKWIWYVTLYMWILIHIASENFCAMSKSIYNMGKCISRMLTFIDIMHKFKCDMRFLIFCMFSFIYNVSWSIYDISILSCSMSETIHIVSINPFGCFNSFITWAEIVLSVSNLDSHVRSDYH